MEDTRRLDELKGQIIIHLELSQYSAPAQNFIDAMDYLFALPAHDPELFPLGGSLPRICSRHAYDDCPSCFGADQWDDNQWVEFEDSINQGDL